MLNRVLEPESMDTPSEAQAYDSMDHEQVNREFVDDLLKHGTPSGSILDLGTGTARIPIELCRRGVDDCTIRAVDSSQHMLDLALANVVFADFPDQIFLELVDAKQLPYADGRFDVVMSNSIVHHVADPASVLSEAVRVTRSGGLLFFRDLLRPDNEQELESLIARHAAGATAEQRQLFSASLAAALSLEEIRSEVTTLGFPAESVNQTSDRHWTWATRKS